MQRRAGLKIGVLSNFTLASLEPSLEATGLAGMIGSACPATVIGSPEARMWLTASQRAALGVEPRECLFFDDEQPCVDGKRTAGMTAYLVDHNRNEHDLARAWCAI